MQNNHLKGIRYYENVPAGFPSPAEDHMDKPLDLHELLITHPASTFMVRVSGNSMQGVGIFEGDIVIVDKSLEAHSNSIVIAVLDGGFTLKRYVQEGASHWLKAENPYFPAIEVSHNESFRIWGVVTYVIHCL